MNPLRDVTSSIVLVGAYGRTYESKKQAVADWEAGKDFRIINGPYCSIRDLEYLQNESRGIFIVTKQGHVRVG